ncbi:MAG TPA: DUF192 domain-containing protein [Gemmatimonadaceae bacterium]|jgi:hypothetical protein
MRIAHRRHFGWLALAATTVSVALACSSHPDADNRAPSYENLLAFDTAAIRIVAQDTSRLTVQLAESQDQHTMGLMERRTLAPGAGMLFLYPTTQPSDAAYWMFRTRIALDIAFIDSAGTIGTVLTMQPCPSDLASGCPAYPPSAPYRAALEVNAGYFAQHHIIVGSRVMLGDTVSRRRATQPTK